MTISDQRLHLFALLTEFEADAREIISKYICDDHSISEDVGRDTYALLKGRAAGSYPDQQFDDRALLIFMDIGDAIRTLIANRTLLPHVISTALTKTIRELEALPGIRNRVMHRRPIEFDDLPTVTDTLRSLTRSAGREFSRSKATLLEVAAGTRLPSYEKAFAYDSEPTTLNNLPQPDFEDTGFMGRRDQIDDLRKAIAGPFPVITVLGVGGAGKSALALHVAYDILNTPGCPFDAIIWTTAKTSRLTGADVMDIAGAISTSVGIAEAALRELGEAPDPNLDPFARVRELLGHFRILLFIDNLETILDERVRSFVRDIPNGSKIVFTSRVGLGAYDFVVPIGNLGAKEAASYFRRVASVWKQTGLLQTPNADLSGYLVRLNYSPLGIKWFVQAVSAGASIQRLLANPAVLLTFCLENIIDKLSVYAKQIISALAVTGREQSMASLHYITGIDPWAVEDALRELIGSQLTTVKPSRFGEEDRYKIAAIAQTYLSRLYPLSAAAQQDIIGKQSQLTQMAERAEAERKSGYVFDPSYITVRPDFSGTDSVAASYLRRAMVAARRNDFDDAFAEIDRAKDIAASFFEVFRVEGFISANQGNTIRAQTAYEEAIALRPNHPPLLILYAGFLLRHIGNGSGAEKVMRQALECDPSSPEMRMEFARTLLYQHEFAVAWEELRKTDTGMLRNGRAWRMFCDLLVQTCTRDGEKSIEQRDAAGFEGSMVRLGTTLSEMPSYSIDEHTEGHLRFAVSMMRKFIRGEGQTPAAETVDGVLSSVCSIIGEPMADKQHQRVFLQGWIDTLAVDKPFGFVEGEGGERLFFHRNNLQDKAEFAMLQPGTVVGYSLGSNNQGRCADEVFIVPQG